MKLFRRNAILKGLRKAALIAALLVVAPCVARSVDISEVCSSNSSSYKADNGEYPDWIELYNPLNQAVDLSGYYISDDEDDPLLFQLNGYSIEPGGYLILKADDVQLPFKLSASGCFVSLASDDGPQELVSVPPLGDDITYSRQGDGAYQVTKATPGARNVAGYVYEEPVYVTPPAFSHAAGFYEDVFTLTIDAYKTDRVYYTIDGSIPNENSIPYEKAIVVDDACYHKNNYSARTDISVRPVVAPKVLQPKCAVIRAVAIDKDGNRSKTVTNTYFIDPKNFSTMQNISIMSIVVDPHDMFDVDNGIYMLGSRYSKWLTGEDYDPELPINNIPANYRIHGIEVPASVQWFDANRKLSLTQDVGLRINGNFSRHDAQKSLKLYARKRYSGSGTLDARFWPDSGKPKKVVVRNGGNNHVMMFLDSFAHTLLSKRSLPYSRSTPCIVFIDGEFWGLYNLRESQDDDYIAQYANVDADNVVMIKNGALKEGKIGDLALYESFMDTVSSTNCFLEKDYSYIQTLMDVDSYLDYLAGGIYIECVDWLNISNNFSLWRTREVGAKPVEDGRWRWIYQDLDYSCGWGHSDPTPVEYLLKEVIFSSLWTNADFRDSFLTRVMDIANIDCAMTRVNELLDGYAEYYRLYMQDTNLRFYSNNTLEMFDEQVADRRQFFENRPKEVVDQLKKALRMDRDAHTLLIESNVDGKNSVAVNDREVTSVSNVWSGLYFEGCPIDVRALNVAGYDFIGWYEDGSLLSTDASITVDVNRDRILSARYVEDLKLISLDSDNPPMLMNAEVALFSGLWNYDGRLLTDAGIASSIDEETGALTLTSDGAWAKKAGFEVQFDSVRYDKLSIHMKLDADEWLNDRWAVLYSVDGSRYEELSDLRLSEGTNDVSLKLPEQMSDTNVVKLRFETDSKPTTKKSASLTIREAEVFGELRNTSLASLKQCISICENALGERFTAPDLSLFESMTQTEVSAQVRLMYEKLAGTLVMDTAKSVADMRIDSPKLYGLDDFTCLTIGEDTASYTSEISFEVDGSMYEGVVYLYKWTGDDLNYMQTAPINEGIVRLRASSGVYILLDRPVDQFRYSISFRSDPIPPELIEKSFYGILPSDYTWMDVELYGDYREDMLFTLPDGALRSNIVWMSCYSDGAIQWEKRLSRDADGAFTLEASTPGGTYLLLPRQNDDYRLEAEFFDENRDPAPGGEVKNGFDFKTLIIGVAAIVFIVAIAIAIILIRRKKKR